MGLFDFVAAAGKALGFGGSDEPEAEAIKKEVEALGLDVEGLDVTVEGDTVKVSGAAASQEMKEKVILAVGNVAGVAQVDENLSAKTGGDASSFHTVAKGDTLWAISSKHLGDGSKYMAIFEANRPMLSDPDKIYPGQVLRIPKA
ncbi:MAG: peptidoglycan-binding protein LysM [Pseudomonadota bacterium]